METIFIAFLAVSYITTGVAALGPHQEVAECEKVAIVSDRTGEVLYYNCK